MNSEKIQQIGQLRNRLSGSLKLNEKEKSDGYLLRYLDASDFNIDKAETYFRKNFEWRKENYDESWKSDFISNICKIEYLENSKEGDPVIYVPVGQWNLKQIGQHKEQKNYIQFIIHFCENIENVIFTSSGSRSQCVFIVDYYGFSLKQAASFTVLEMFRESSALFDLRYPLLGNNTWFVRAPKIFPIIFNVFKKAMSAKSIKGIKVFGEKDNYQGELLKAYNPESIPEHLGGKFKLKITGNIKDNEEELMDDYVPIEVPSGEIVNVEFEIDEPETVINWSFKTTGYDIGFALLFNGKKVLIPTKRVNSHLEIEIGQHTCEKPGKYALQFDNAYSLLVSKVVNYIVTLSVDDDEEEDD